MPVIEKSVVVENAVGRMVPELVNGRRQDSVYGGWASIAPRAPRLALRYERRLTILRMATNALVILLPHCKSADCGTAW